MVVRDSLPRGRRTERKNTQGSQSLFLAARRLWGSLVSTCGFPTWKIRALTLRAVIQLARLASFSPIIATASLNHAEYLKELGATHVIDRKLDPESIKAAIGQITTKPFDVVYDAVSFEDTQNIGYDVLAQGGTLVVVTSIHIAEEKRSAAKRITAIFASPILPDRRELSIKMYKHVPTLFASGELKVSPRRHKHTYPYADDPFTQTNRTEVVPNGLAGIQDGLERLGRKEVSAVKLIAHPQETP